MPTLLPADLDLLRQIHAAGGKLHIVTHRNRVEDAAALALSKWAFRMCDLNVMRLERLHGNKNKPGGEACCDFVLTKNAAKRLATQG